MMGIAGNKLLYNLDNVVSGRPITADIFLTDWCDNRCGYCRYRHADSGAVGSCIDFGHFVSYVGILRRKGVKGVILTGGGEPTLDPDFDKITAWLDEQGIPYGVNTNFNVFHDMNPRFLKVSLDGWDAESYRSIRGRDAYEKTRRNIIAFAERNHPTRLGIQTVVTDIDACRKFYEANKDLPADYIVFRPVESPNSRYYAQSDRNVEEIRGWLRDNLASKDSRVVVNYKFDHVFEGFDTCFAHRLVVTVNARGELLFCCHKPNETFGRIDDCNSWKRWADAETDMAGCDRPCRLTGANLWLKEVGQASDGDSMFV